MRGIQEKERKEKGKEREWGLYEGSVDYNSIHDQ